MWIHRHVYESFYWELLAYFIDTELTSDEKLDKRGNLRPLDAKAWWLIERKIDGVAENPAMLILNGLTTCKWEFYRILKNYVTEKPSNPVKGHFQFIDPRYFYHGLNYMKFVIEKDLQYQIALRYKFLDKYRRDPTLEAKLKGHVLLHIYLSKNHEEFLSDYPDLNAIYYDGNKSLLKIDGDTKLYATSESSTASNSKSIINDKTVQLPASSNDYLLHTEILKLNLHDFLMHYLENLSKQDYSSCLTFWHPEIREQLFFNNPKWLLYAHPFEASFKKLHLWEFNFNFEATGDILVEFKTTFTETTYCPSRFFSQPDAILTPWNFGYVPYLKLIDGLSTLGAFDSNDGFQRKRSNLCFAFEYTSEGYGTVYRNWIFDVSEEKFTRLLVVKALKTASGLFLQQIEPLPINGVAFFQYG